VAKASAEIRSLARSHTETAVNTLVSIMRQEKSPAAARVQAATALLDRGYGKPKQPLSGDDDGEPIHLVIERVIRDGVAKDNDG
jgi:hypothetical protein